MRKPIYVMLDILLILGALVSIATIGGGKWFIQGLETYLPISTEWEDVNLIRSTMNTPQESSPAEDTQMISACPATSTPGPSGQARVAVQNAILNGQQNIAIQAQSCY